MNEDELVANLFRINQTKQRLLKDNVQSEKKQKMYIMKLAKKFARQSKNLVAPCQKICLLRPKVSSK